MQVWLVLLAEEADASNIVCIFLSMSKTCRLQILIDTVTPFWVDAIGESPINQARRVRLYHCGSAGRLYIEEARPHAVTYRMCGEWSSSNTVLAECLAA